MEPHQKTALSIAIQKDALADVFAGSESDMWRVEALPKAHQVLWPVEKGLGVTCNGGFQYFFENDWPGQPPYKLFSDAFRSIGVHEAAGCLDDAVQMFPSKEPHLDFEMRRTHLANLRSKSTDEDSLIDKLGFRIMDLEEEIWRHLTLYVLANLESFPTAMRKWHTRKQELVDAFQVA